METGNRKEGLRKTSERVICVGGLGWGCVRRREVQEAREGIGVFLLAEGERVRWWVWV